MNALDFFASLGIAVLAGLGVGSGGLFTVYLSLVRGVGQSVAQGMNLLFFVFALSASAIIGWRQGAYRGSPLFTVLLFGSLGALCGSFLSGFLSGDLIRHLFGGFMAAAGLFSLKSREKH